MICYCIDFFNGLDVKQKWKGRRDSEPGAGYNKMEIANKDVNRNEERTDTGFCSGYKHTMQNG